MDSVTAGSEYKFQLDGIYASELHIGVVAPEEFDDTPGGIENARLSWDWRLATEDRKHIEVFVGMQINPTASRREEIRVGVVGRFTVVASTEEGIGMFVRQNAVAVILPFVRQSIMDLSSHSFWGPVVPPLLNVVASMQRMKPELATGARQSSGEIPITPGTPAVTIAPPRARKQLPAKRGGTRKS